MGPQANNSHHLRSVASLSVLAMSAHTAVYSEKLRHSLVSAQLTKVRQPNFNVSVRSLASTRQVSSPTTGKAVLTSYNPLLTSHR